MAFKFDISTRDKYSISTIVDGLFEYPSSANYMVFDYLYSTSSYIGCKPLAEMCISIIESAPPAQVTNYCIDLLSRAIVRIKVNTKIKYYYETNILQEAEQTLEQLKASLNDTEN